MTSSGFSLFSVGEQITGVPSVLSPATFTALGAMELQDVERWIKSEPRMLGEELLIVSCQLAQWDKTRDRLDLLALDRVGKLVIVEIKRDDSGTDQNVQAIRYAAYCSTLGADDIARLYAAYRHSEHGEAPDETAARDALERWITPAALTSLDEDEQPRIILAAGSFHPGVTSTSLWLARNFGVDITCVQLTPYEVEGQILIGSHVVLPLREAAEFEVRLQEKQRRSKRTSAEHSSLDLQAAASFIDSIPDGRWASYGDVAAAGGAPKGAQAVGTWLMRTDAQIPKVYRVLNRFGEVSPGWQAVDTELPPTPDAVRGRLQAEGVTFDEQNRADQAQRWVPEDWTGSSPPA